VTAWSGELRNNATDEHEELRFVTLAEAAVLDLADDHLLGVLTACLAASS